MSPPDPPTELDLRHGDCLEGMRALDAGSVDLVVTSPPYNLGIAYSTYRDDLSRGEYLDWCEAWAREVRRVLADGGSFFLNVGASPKDPLGPHQLILRLAQQGGLFTLQNTFHWIKSITVRTPRGEQVSAGHFKPINSPRFANDCHEYVFHLTKHGDVPIERRAIGVPYEHKSNIGRWGHTGGEDRRCRGNAWFIPYQTILRRSKDRPHPATFPAELAEWCIKLHGKGAQTVMLDPFLGIGHAAEAARRCSVRRFIGFEIDAAYLDEAKRRMAEGDPQGELGL